MVFMENSSHFIDTGLGNAEIFSKSADEPVTKIISDIVPDDIANEISDHECRINRNEFYISQFEQDTEDH